MRELQSFDDIYPAVDELVVSLEASGDAVHSRMLHMLVHKMVWTTGTELLWELGKELHKIEVNEAIIGRVRADANRLREYILSVLRACGADLAKLARFDEQSGE